MALVKLGSNGVKLTNRGTNDVDRFVYTCVLLAFKQVVLYGAPFVFLTVRQAVLIASSSHYVGHLGKLSLSRRAQRQKRLVTRCRGDGAGTGIIRDQVMTIRLLLS